jgi:hypothetical protein
VPASTLSLRFLVTVPLQPAIEAILKKYVEVYTVRQAGTCKKGTAFELTYRLRLRSDMQSLDLIRELKVLEGMQSVEWKS